jgi:hypothetical protein
MSNKQCLVCKRGEQETPLVNLDYREQRMWICPQHLPMLIHNPQELAGQLPGAENLKPADHHD